MTEEVQNTSDIFNNNQNDSPSFDFDDSTFFSPQIKPENIFCSDVKDTSEMQLASKILCFPFNLDYFNLIFLKDEKDPELIDPFCTVILGDIERVRFSDSVLKMVFYSKDRTTPLNLGDYPNEINSLTNFPGIEFICICLNKMFIQCEDDNTTKEAYNSLQKNYSSSDFLYDEEGSINSSEKQFKGINNLFSSEKKNPKDFNNFDELLSPDKNVKKLDFFNENEDNNFQEQNDSNTKNNNSLKESDYFKKSIWNSQKKSQNEDIKAEDKKIESNQNQTSQDSMNKSKPQIFPPQSFSPFVFPMYNISKSKAQINPLLFMQYSKLNPFLLQTAFALQQNIIKLQQMNLKGNEKNNGNINFNGKNNNINNETDKAFSPSNNKESATNSNTSSTTSSKESSPAINNHDKSYTNNNMNLPNINFGLFNGFTNTLNAIQNLNINNNKFNNNKEFTHDLLNIPKPENKSDSNQKQEDIKINPNINLQQIVINNTFKEYVPKNNNNNSNNSLNNNKTKNQNVQNTPSSPVKDVEFQTNSTRDYQFKYVSRYIVQIENEKNFPVTKMIIGNSGKLLRNILVKNCINNGDHTTKIRLRGKGSGYKEGPKNEESKDPMELCISSLNLISYLKCSNEIENLLRNVYYQYYLYQCNNKKENDNDVPVVMKKILKYQYVVNRYNTLAKEEKRRKKEEELKQVNQVNKNSSNNNNDNI